jgi:hypothetical protein
MRLSGFTFKNEAKWMLIFSLALPLIGILILLEVMVWRRF